jgi:translation initiation factor IF-2
VRVYEAARHYGVTSKDVLDVLAELDYAIRSASSNVPEEALDELGKRFADKSPPESKEADEGASGPAEPDTGVPSFLETEISPKVEKIVIGSPEESPEKGTAQPTGESEEATTDLESGESTGEAETPEEKRQRELRRILLDKGKVRLHTKIHKSQRSIGETSSAIRRQIMRTKAKRFGEFRRAREQQRLKKAAEEQARRKAEEAARAAAEAARATEEQAHKRKRPAEEEPAAAPVQEKAEPKRARREPKVEIVLEPGAAEPKQPQEVPAGATPESPRAKPAAPGRQPVPRPARRQSRTAWKREKRARFQAQQAATREQAELAARTIRYNETTTVANIADDLGIRPTELIKKLLGMGMMVTIQQRLDPETVQIIADEYEFQVEETSLYEEEALLTEEEEDQPEALEPRPPVVTIMGHVDHGKTKLLDAIREANVVDSEAGGITQHIGAYQVELPGRGTVVFLDTPGHEAFTAMRARGALVTDVVVLVVAANEGVMPQTVEAINHAKAAEVPILVTVNKMDLPEADPDRVKQQLAEYGLVSEEWGGKTIYVPVSALKKEGIQELLEALLLEAELLELKANPYKRAKGVIIESKLDRGRGAVASVLVQEGTLRAGNSVITGVYSGRVRALTNDRGEPVEEAGPATPVEVLGLEGVPTAGDPFIVVTDEKEAKQISLRLQQAQRERELHRVQHVTLDHLYSQIEEGATKQLNMIVRGDVHGSVEALCESLAKIDSDKVRVEVIHSGVGAIHESDVMLASASNALIIGFNVRPGTKVEEIARREHVEIRCYRLIYQAIEDVKKAMVGLMEKEYEEVMLGRCEVREVFRSSKLGTVAGGYVTSGRIVKSSSARLLRDAVVIHEGRIDSLRRFKDPVNEVAEDLECGIGFETFSDIRKGDVVECFELQEVEQTL